MWNLNNLGQDVAAMVEAHNAAEWERINTVEPMDADEVNWELSDALDSVVNACQHLGEAAKLADGFPVWSRIMSVFSDLETLQTDIQTLKDQVRKEAKRA